MEKPEKIIFLDVDGVIQPFRNQERFNHDLKELRKYLAREYNNDEYLEMDRFDLGAVCFDWDEDVVDRVKRLCVQVPAQIVITSTLRRYFPLSRIKDYFRLHDLDQYIVGEIPKIRDKSRCENLTIYMENNRHIKQFAILDDSYFDEFEKAYPKQFVHCEYFFSEQNYRHARSLLLD